MQIIERVLVMLMINVIVEKVDEGGDNELSLYYFIYILLLQVRAYVVILCRARTVSDE